MKNLAHVIHSKQTNLLVSIFMAFAWSLFSYAHVLGFLKNGDWTLLLFCASETLVAVLFLVRSEPVSVSTNPIDWALAISATFVPFLLTPETWGVLPEGKLMLLIGTSIQIAGLISLNRSFGLVAAKREIKMAGMYKVIRHPLYASYLFSFTGYVLANTSKANVAIYITMMTLLLFRLLREEKHLCLDPTYSQYMNRVRYRVIPYVF